MLDINNPRTPIIFRASNIEDEMRKIILHWRDSGGSIGAQEAKVIESCLEKLSNINDEHFGGSVKIKESLDKIYKCVVSQNAVASWNAFLDLAEYPGDNFGTWAI